MEQHLADKKQVRCQTLFLEVQFSSFIWLKSLKKNREKRRWQKIASCIAANVKYMESRRF
jgi:hypothetical protein